MSTITLRTWSHILFWLTIGIPIVGAFLTAGAAIGRYYVDRRIAGPWLLSSRDEQTFRASLKDAPKGKVAIEYIRSDEARSRPFAVKIQHVLKAAGYDVWGYMAGFMQADAPPLIGIQISAKDEKSNTVAGGLQRAFKAIGFDARVVHRRPQDATYDDDFAVAYIGMKP